MPEREWDRESNEPEEFSDGPRMSVNDISFHSAAASGSFVVHAPTMADTGSLIIDEPTTSEFIRIDLGNASWVCVFKGILSWIFTPILMVISKMFKKVITIRTGRTHE